MIVPPHPPYDRELPSTVHGPPLALKLVKLGMLGLAPLKEAGHGAYPVHE